LALRTGPVGLWHEAGSVRSMSGLSLRAKLGLAAGLSRGLLQLRALLSGLVLRPALNSQLRTGTDSGNPTV
jgi:hypothetical protein